MVYDDSAFNDGFTLTDSYSVYPNAFNSYSNDGRYTKHIYIGSERIASQLSTSFPAQGNVAGYNVGIRVDYANKRDLMNAQIDSAYTAFGLVYKGINHDVDNYYPFNNPNYWNNAHHAPAVDDEQAEQAPFNSQRDMVYYYHKDHLGSSAFITNDSACVVQQIEYLPYGEVFLEKQRYTSDYQTPYRFNGKELDEETGLYYYGARYMNPKLSIWYATDPMEGKYPNISSYSYCAGNPVKQFDINGCDWVSTNNDNTNIWSWTNTINNEEEALNAGYNGYLPNGSILNNARIGDGKCGAVYLGYSADDICYTISNHDVTPWQVGVEWLTGKGPRHRDFTNGDYFSELLRQHSHYQESILLAMHELANGNYSGTNNYKLEGFEGVGKYVKDYSTLATGGLTGNLAVTYLGSYTLKWTSRIEGDYAVINFTINNSSTMESGTRPPVIGYTNWWKSSIGRWINESFQSGMGSKTTQTFRLTERIKMTYP